MNRPALVLCLALLIGPAAAQSDHGPTGQASGDNDPRISSDEIIAPAVEWEDTPGWRGVVAYEDPESLRCEGRSACRQIAANGTVDPE